jgi:hypothetical protein
MAHDAISLSNCGFTLWQAYTHLDAWGLHETQKGRGKKGNALPARHDFFVHDDLCLIHGQTAERGAVLS